MTKAIESVGELHAQELIQLIADIEAFDNAHQVIKFRCVDVHSTTTGVLSIAFGTRYRALFEPVGRRFKVSDTNQVKWGTVRRIKLMEIVECK